MGVDAVISCGQEPAEGLRDGVVLDRGPADPADRGVEIFEVLRAQVGQG